MNLGSGRFKEFRGDLHIHTCLSPCADLEMSPRNIVKEAKDKGLHFIGICDHNSAENVRSSKKAGEREKIAVIGGMEVSTKEEVHILALFDEDRMLDAFQSFIYRNLHGTNDERLYGEQVVVNEDDEVVSFNRKLLIGAVGASVYEIVDMVHSMKGLAIASHVDREGFGIIGQLGFIPEELALDAVEISDASGTERVRIPDGMPVVLSSDAHYLKDIGRANSVFVMNEINVKEMGKALKGESGRRVVI